MKRRTFAAPLGIALSLAFFGLLAQGAVPDVPTGQWLPGPALAQPRAGAVSVALDDGRVLVIGGRTSQGPVDTVEVLNADGSMAVAAPMLARRAGHAAAKLPDGRILVVGGTTLVTSDTENGSVTSEAVTNSTEIFDSFANVWSPAASLAVGRSGHTATAVADGRVLVAGGTGQDGAALDSFEVFDAETGQFATPGLMSAARANHAAAVAGTTKVLVAGGRNANGVLGTADVINVESGTVSSVVLNSPRADASATTLLDGKVLVAGGSNGAADLASAEVVDPVTGISMPTGSMGQTRSGHQALLLNHNNTVLVTGGTSGGAAGPAAEQFIPWTGQFSATGSPANSRAAAVVSNVSKDGAAWLAAGRATDGTFPGESELYGFATIATNRDDYSPGMTVYVSAGGWLPNETVTFELREIPGEHQPRSFSVTADQNGRIVNATLFVVEQHHFGIRFYLRARGAASQAEITFTDAIATDTTITSGQNPSSVNQSVTFTATVTRADNGLSVGATGVVTFGTGGSSCGSMAPFATNVALNTSGQAIASRTFTSATPGIAVRACYNGTGGSTGTSSSNGSLTQVVNAKSSTSLNVSPALGAYGGTVSLSATLTSASSGVNGKTIAFTLNGNTVGSATTNASGVATLMGVALTGINAGSYPTGVGASFAEDASFTASSGTAPLTVNKAATATAVTCGTGPFTYDGSPKTPCSASVTGPGGLSQTLTVSYIDHVDAGVATANATYAESANYLGSSDSKTFSIAKAATTTTLTCAAGPFTYDGSAKTPCSASVAGPGGLTSTLAVSYSNNVNAGNAFASATYAESGNYLESSDSKTFTIGKAVTASSVTCTAGPYTYNGAAHTPCMASVAGPGGLSEELTVTYLNNTNAGIATASASYAESANHLGSSDSTTFTIDKAATVTAVTCGAGPFTFNGTAHEPCSAAVTGPGGLDEALTVSYLDNLNAGTATASANYVEAGNYLESNDSATFTIDKAATVTAVTCGDGPFTFKGSAHEPCSASVTGPGLNQSLEVSHQNNVNAGTATASATYAESDNYLGSSDSATFTIDKAATVTTVTCDAGPFTFKGSAHEPCSASVTGPAGLTQSLDVSYHNNVNAGTATAIATYAESDNYLGSTDSATFTIDKAATVTTVTCGAGPFTFSGSAHAPCSASVTGPAGLTQSLDVSYHNNVNAGTATASAAYAESDNYLGSTDSETFTIDKAATVTMVTCSAGPFTFSGSAQTPCSASVTGPALTESLVVGYQNNVNAGTATATATYAESGNYLGSTDSETFTIDKAATVTTVTCSVGPFTFSGSAQTPCSASVTGPALTQSLVVSYQNNVNAGTVTASATYAESDNYLGSSDSATFTIDKAATVTTVTCDAGPFTFSGSAQTPCSASVTGPAGLTQSLDVSYHNNVNAGTATASASYAESGNYLASSDSESFTIDKATSTTTVTCETSVIYNASAQTPCSAAVKGAGGLNQALTVDYTNNTNPGTATASAAFAGDTNHHASNASTTFGIGYGVCSPVVGPGGVILQPINTDGSSVFARKGGSTIPVKFRVCDASGNVIANPVAVFAGTGGSLTMLGAVRATINGVNEVGTTDIPDVAFRYSANQWIFNMGTGNLTQGTTYTFRINLAAGNIVFVVAVK